MDGTILSVNSFPYWVLYLLTGHFPRLSWLQRAKLSWRSGKVMFRRKVLKAGHDETKLALQKLWSEAVKDDPDDSAARYLASLLQDYLRPNLRRVLEAVAERQYDAVLATSAAAEYADRLGHMLGFSQILTTPPAYEAGRIENCKERKRDRVLSLLAAQGWQHRRRVFFTDHIEDLPLMRECELTLWFGKDEALAEIRAQAPQSRVYACRNISAAEVLRLTSSEQPLWGSQYRMVNSQ